MTTITLKINERSKAGKTLKDLIHLLKTQPGVEVTINEKDSPYNPEFVAKIKRAESQKGEIVDTNDIWKSLGLK